MVTSGRGRSPQFMRSVHNRPALRRRGDLAVFMQLSLVSLGIAAGGLIGWLGNEFVQRSQTFRLHHVSVEDVPPDLQLAVETVLRPALGANLLTMDLDWVHRQVQRIPAVQTATVRRVLPGTLDVSVRARKAFARLESPTWTRAVSRDGVILGLARASAGLPVVRLAESVDAGNDQRLPDPLSRQFEDAVQFLEWLPRADRELYRRLNYLRVERRGLVAVVESPDWELVFGDARRLDAKLASMVSILKRETPAPGSLIDLRYEAMVVVRAAPSNGGPEE